LGGTVAIMLTAPWSNRLLWDPSADWSVPSGSDPTGIPRQQTGLLLAGSGLVVHNESHISEGDGLQHHRAVVEEAVLH